MNLYHLIEQSSHQYISPVSVVGKKSQTYLQLGFRSPAHKGPFFHAEDLVVPDPRTERLVVQAPESGMIVALTSGHTKWGGSRDYQLYLNYVTVQVTGRLGYPGSEFYELAHVDFTGIELKIGTRIEQGVQIGWTGLNGWMTVTNGVVDSHLHFMVGIWLGNSKFKSLKIRYR